jgi:hypothetical protein
MECNKKIIDVEEYLKKLNGVINKLEYENDYDNRKIKFFSKHKMIDLVDGTIQHGWPITWMPADTPEELEFKKGLMVRGWKSGVIRRMKQVKKIKSYYEWVYVNQKHVSKLYLTHGTMKFIFKTILGTNYFDRAWVSERLIPEYIDPDLIDTLKAQHLEASIDYIRKHIYKD